MKEKEMERPKVIIADDHEIVIDGIKSMLGTHPGFEIVGQALNGQEVLSLLLNKPNFCDVIIADVSMPIMTGIDLCRKIKQDYPAIKVLILSMYSSPAVVRDCIHAEADGYVLKNAGKEVLIEALKAVCNHGTYYSEEIIPILSQQASKESRKKEHQTLLSKRELEVLTLIVEEYTSEEIASKLFISKKTVDNHRASILDKTSSKSTIGLIKFAIVNGLLHEG
jgi:DNA-binding NarL/FixJ family response regulator